VNRLNPILSLAFATACTVSVFGQANVSVDASKTLRTVDGRTLGMNVACWDWNLGNTPSAVSASESILSGLGTGALRYPGGGTADQYFWRTNQVENVDSSGHGLGTYWQAGTDYPTFAAINKAVGSQAFITVNYGTDTADSAAAWVADAKAKGYGLKYWEVGNECYGTWEADNNVPAHDPVEYATRFADYFTKMKAADPTIKVGAVITTTTEGQGNYVYPSEAVTDPATSKSHTEWNYVVLGTLKAKGVMPDFLICHRYEQNAGQENDATLLTLAGSATSGWAADASMLRTVANDFYGSSATGIELCVTENNSVHNNPGKQTVSLVNALYAADSFGSLLQTEFNSLLWWAFRNGPNLDNSNKPTGNLSSSLYGWLNFGDYGIIATSPSPAPSGYPSLNTPFSPYYAWHILSKFAAQGDTVVSASSDNTLVAAYAVTKQDGSLSLMLINKSPTQTTTATISLNHFTPKASGTSYTYGITQDNAAKSGTGSADIAQGTVSNYASTFTASLSPYSITVLNLPSQASKPVAVAQPSSVTVSTGSTAVLTFSASGAPAPTFQWYLNGQPISGATSATLVISGATAASQGSYTCLAANASGSVTSSPATLTVISTTTSGHLINISCLGFVGTGANILQAGFVVSGGSGGGSLPVLVRASGPALAPYNVPNLLPDPELTLNNTTDPNKTVVLAVDNGWKGDTSIYNEAKAVGAFSWGSKATPDSAFYETGLSGGNYTAQVAGAAGDTGNGLVEVYDATPSGTYVDGMPRLINLSTLVQIQAGTTPVYDGFVIQGSTARTVLIRATGPTLSAFNLTGLLKDPQLILTNTTNSPNVVVATNTGWGADPAIMQIARSVGAFSWGGSATQDSAIVVTLAPGSYTAGVVGATGDAGLALIEVYEVP
jgi:Immunoglobulin domain